MENLDALQTDPQALATNWKLSTSVLQSVPMPQAMGMGAEPGFDSEEADVNTSDVSWDDAELCVQKARGVLFSDLFFFSKRLSSAHLAHLQNTIVANKPIRDKENGAMKLR